MRPLVLFMMNTERPRPRLGYGRWEKGRWMRVDECGCGLEEVGGERVYWDELWLIVVA